MSAVAQIHSWVVHIARKDDEWATLCGALLGPGDTIADAPDETLWGYKVCVECKDHAGDDA